jgi:hypothetical protein
VLYGRLLPDGVFVYLRHKAAPKNAGGLAGVFWLNYGAFVAHRRFDGMRSCSFILADLMVALGRDPYHAACTEMWLMVMIIAPVLVLAPYLLCRWDEYMRAENARRRAARKRIYERARRNG